MKEIIKSFKAIYENDRKVLLAMFGLLITSAILIIMPFLNLSSGSLKIWVRYSDISRGYSEGDWWYLLTFSFLGLILGLGHCALSARLYTKRGAGLTLMFLAISTAIVLLGIAFLYKITGEA